MQYLQQLSGRPVGLWPGLGQYPDVTVNAASSTKQIENPWEGMLRPKQSSSLLDKVYGIKFCTKDLFAIFELCLFHDCCQGLDEMKSWASLHELMAQAFRAEHRICH